MTSRLFLEHLEYSMSNKSFKVSVDKYGKVCNFLAVTGFKGTDGGQFDGAHTKHIVTRLITTKLITTKHIKTYLIQRQNSYFQFKFKAIYGKYL